MTENLISSCFCSILILFGCTQLMSSALRIEPSKINLNLPAPALGVGKSDIWAHGKRKHVVCMLDSWSFWRKGDGEYNVKDHVDGNLCTHIIYRAVIIDNNFHLKIKDEQLEINQDYFHTVVNLKRKFQHLKIFISTGGFDESDTTLSALANLTSSFTNRQVFIQSVMEFLKRYKFDGLNLEWKLDYNKENKQRTDNKGNFNDLAYELKSSFSDDSEKTFLLSVMVPGEAWQISQIYDIKYISQISDMVILTTVDYHGQWFKSTGHSAPFRKFEDLMQKLFVEQEVKNVNKFVLAIPLYGRNYKLDSDLSGSSEDYGLGNPAGYGTSGPFTNQTGVWSYPEICIGINMDEKTSSSWKTYWDKIDLVPFATDGREWVSFDSPLSIFGKVLLAVHFNLGGVAAWTIDNDDFHGQCPGKHKNPLLRTINYAMGLAINTSPLDLCSFLLLKNKTPQELSPRISGNVTDGPEMTFRLRSDVIIEGISLGIQPVINTWSKSEVTVITTKMVLRTEETQFTPPASGFPTTPVKPMSPDVEKAKELPSKDVKCQNLQSSIEPGSKSSTLKFGNFTQDQIGVYEFESENIFGTTKISFTLNRQVRQRWRMSTTWKWIIVGVVILIINLIIGFVIYWRLRKNDNILTEYEMKAFLKGKDNMYTQEVSPENVPYNKNYELAENSFKIEKEAVLGSGQFGIVYKGFAKRSQVAVKTTKEGAEKQYLMSLLSELKILIYLENHPNIVNLIGASTTNLKTGSVHIFVEFCPHGNLLNYLRGARKTFVSYMHNDKFDGKGELEEPEDIISTHHLVKWSFQIAKALEHLSMKKVIHADLAARNVLVFDRNTVKITDFGLSRKIYNYTNYVKNNQEPLPWRWMAIESLRDLTFSSQSDIWSYGMTIWEIFSLGQTPYSGMSWTTDFVDQLSKDFRIHKPKYATSSVYRVMKKCWQEDPDQRPKAEDLSNYFGIILNESFSKDYEQMME